MPPSVALPLELDHDDSLRSGPLLVRDPPRGEEAASLQHRLARLNERRLRPTLAPAVGGTWRLDSLADELARETADRLAEDTFVAAERELIAPRLRDLCTHPVAFVRWFEDLRATGPGQDDPLFPWLAEEASLAELRWFLGQEIAGEAGFDDLLALVQLKMPPAVKLEMARNYWDEMGRGHEAGMHGLMLERLAQGLNVSLPPEEIVWESVALSNLMVALAWNRRYAYQAIGALGVIELTAPGRSAQVNAGLRRLEIPAGLRKYFALHATLDLQHSSCWNREVLMPLVAQGPDVARAIAEGALLRLNAGARCFVRYRSVFQLDHPRRATPPPP